MVLIKSIAVLLNSCSIFTYQQELFNVHTYLYDLANIAPYEAVNVICGTEIESYTQAFYFGPCA